MEIDGGQSMLHEAVLGLMRHMESGHLAEVILAQAAGLIGSRHGFINLCRPEAGQVPMGAGIGVFASRIDLADGFARGLAERVLSAGVPIVLEDLRAREAGEAVPEFDGVPSAVGILLTSAAAVHGVIVLAVEGDESRLNASAVDMLSRFAALAGIVLDKARLFEEALHEQTRLREGERRYRSLLESSPDPIVVYDMQGAATYVNPAFERTLGWSRNQLLGQRLDFVPAENRPETEAAIRSMLSGETIQLFETRRRTRDGRVLDVQISSTLYEDETGRPAGNIVILRDISPQKQAERELKRSREQLEQRVEARTAELAASNRRLAREVEERKGAEEALRRREAELEAQSRHLAEVNTALKVLLKQREADKSELQQNVLANIKDLVNPYLERLKKSRLPTEQLTLVKILETNLNHIVSPFIGRLASKTYNLTPMEIRIANLVRAGRTNPEMADLLCISKNTVMFHRFNIRRKLGLSNKKINLATHLLNFEE